MTTTVERLRIAARHDESQGRMMNEAADLIEQQRREVEQLGVKLLSEEFQQVVDWKDEIKHLHERCERLNKAANEYKQENQALAAHVEILRDAANELSFEIAHDPNEPEYKSFGKLQDAIVKSPQTSLAELRAREAKEIYRDTLNDIVDMWERGEIESFQDLYDSDALSDKHVNKIRNGGNND